MADAGDAGSLTLRVGEGGLRLEPGRMLLRDHLEAAGVGAGALYRCELAYEELVTNVLRHAGPPAAAGVDVVATVGADSVCLRFEDAGPPFDPTGHAAMPTPASLADAPLGGLGIPMVRGAASGFAYRRANGRNRVTVTVALD
jgi:anti-sigma regulatory factor (Ser/Thr protein kinase)